MRIDSLLPVALLCLLLGCGRPASEGVRFTIDLPVYSDTSSYYLYTYGSSRITVDTLRPKGKRVRLERVYDRDTLDAFVLFDGSGSIVAPIIPDTIDFSISRSTPDGTLQGTGLRYMSQFETWSGVPPLSVDRLSPDQLSYFKANHQELYGHIALLFTLDRLEDLAQRRTLDSLRRQSNYLYRDWTSLLGFGSVGSMPPESTGSYFFGLLPLSKGDTVERKQVREVLKKRPFLVLSLHVADEAGRIKEELRVRSLLKQIDSLHTPTYTAILLGDSVPSSWLQVGEQGKAPHYFVVDSSGEASELAKALSVRSLPTYLVLDSLNRYRARYSSPDSLYQFIRQPSEP